MQLGLNMSVDDEVLDNPEILNNPHILPSRFCPEAVPQPQERFNSPSNVRAPVHSVAQEVPQSQSMRPPTSPLKQPTQNSFEEQKKPPMVRERRNSGTGPGLGERRNSGSGKGVPGLAGAPVAKPTTK